MIVYHSELTVLRCSNSTIATCSVFSEKTGDDLLESASFASSFYWIWLLQSTAAYFPTQTRKSTIHHLSQCPRPVSKHRDRIFGALILTNRHQHLFERLASCVVPNAKKFFLQLNVHAIWNVCWSH